MRTPRVQSKSSFFWQGLMIVLPVVVLVASGVYALHQDHRLVEQEARRRAAEVAKALSDRLAGPLAAELSRFELIGNAWAGAGVIGGPIPWPGSSPLNREGQERFDKDLAEWKSDYPGLNPAEVFPVRASLRETGALESPQDFPLAPEPPLWLAELTSEQRALWDTARQIELNPSDQDRIRQAWENFLAADPSAAARANAEFALLRLDREASPPAEQAQRWIRFAHRHWLDLSESGLPLPTLALARAFRESAETGLTQTLFNELAGWERGPAVPPSVLTPLLLSEAERLAAKQPLAIQQAVAALRARWECEERLRALARRVREILNPAGALTTNLWFDWTGQRWFALSRPNQLTETKWLRGVQTNRLVANLTEIHFYPKAAVQRAAERSLNRAADVWPPYFKVAVALEDEWLMKTPAPPSAPAVVLGRSEGRLSRAGVVMLGTNSDGRPRLGNEFETLPSHPRLAVEIVLGDAALLYSHARRRREIFGTTIVLAAAVVLIGLVVARQAFRRQIQLNELKSNFVSSVSHELRAPIASVRLMAEGLESGRVHDESKKRDYFKFIVQECRRLSALIDNVLDFSRIEQGRKQYEFEPTDVVALMRHTVEVMGTSAAERGIQLKLDLNETPLASSNLHLLLDGRAIEQALVNLIDNALKHSPKGSTVTVGLDWPTPDKGNAASHSQSSMAHPASRLPFYPSRLLLWVEDRGEGIPAEEHERIFERYYRRGSELRRETQGVGIGLSIVKHIVESHGGRVSVRSAVGQGSRFTMELPMKS